MVNSLARKWRVQVTNDLTLTSGWTDLKGLTTVTPDVAPNVADATDFDTGGYSTSEITLQSWTLTTAFNRIYALIGGVPVYDAGQEIVRGAVGEFADAARVGARWFDRLGGPEAQQGIGLITWKAGTGAVKDLENIGVTFTSTDVALADIDNPWNVGLVPAIGAVAPAGAGTGGSVVIFGSGFASTVASTGIKFGGTAATSFTVLSDNQILAVLPSGSAGSSPITVTNANGASAGFAYTRAA